MFALRAAQPGTLSPLSLARARAANNPQRARGARQVQGPRRGRRSARHGGEDGGGGCPRQKGESGQWLVGRLRCLRDRAANHNCIMIFVDMEFLLPDVLEVLRWWQARRRLGSQQAARPLKSQEPRSSAAYRSY